MSLAKIRWYAARLAAMSPPEVAHRVRELALKRLWSGNRRGWGQFPAGGLAATPDLSVLRERLARGAECAKPAVEQLQAGRLSGLGQSVDENLGPALWFVDPVSRRAWPGPERYCFDIDVRTTGEGLGDVKFVWEINRMQALHPLAAAMAADPAPVLVDRAFAILEGWASANPPFRGVNWFSGIELAMRMVTVTLIVAALPAGRISAERLVFLQRFVAAHAFWLHRYPSRYSSANNHLVAEGLGLFLAGQLFPDADHAADYRAEGRRILEAEAALQILPDGVGAEQSPTYQAFTMEMLAFAALVAEGVGQPLGGIVTDRLTKGAGFLKSLMDEAGCCPEIGDNDEGRVIGCPPDREPRYVASVVAAVAGLVDNPALAPPARDMHLRDHLFCAPEAGSRTAPGLYQFPDGGYTVGRIEISGVPAVLTFDHGPLGYLKLAAHGHADTLAIWLSVGDQPVLVDAGTYLYHSGGALRNRLRSSLSHNTLTIGETSSSLPSSAFSWAARAQGALTGVTAGDWWAVDAAHDGYSRKFSLRHCRSIARDPGGFILTDRLEGAHAPVSVRIGFLIHPSLDCVLDGDNAVLRKDQETVATLILPRVLRPLLVRGDRENAMGLHAPRFGELVETTHLVLTGEMTGEPVATRIVIGSLRR